MGKNVQIWVFGLKIWKAKASRKFQIQKFWNFVLDRFAFLEGRFGRFRVVLTGFSSFWLVSARSGFNNYGSFYSFSDSLTNCCRLTFRWYTNFFSLEFICNIISRSNVRLCLIKNLYHINCLVRSWL